MRDSMASSPHKTPGVLSAVARLLAMTAPLWFLAGMPEYLRVWDQPDGYTVPDEFHFPKQTVWVVGFVMLATVVLLVTGWWQPRHGGSTWWVAAAIVGTSQAIWSVLLGWSFVLSQQDLANSKYGGASDSGQLIEFFLALLAALAAFLLIRDAMDRRSAIGA